MATSTCPNCGGAVDSGMPYCAHCGATMPDAPTVYHPTAGDTQGTQPPADPIRARLEAATQGRYRIEGALGQGGMGAVYRAKDLTLDCPVALKVMLPGGSPALQMVDRFRQEARTIASLRHPHIVKVHDLREHEGLHFFVLDFIEGRSVDRILDAVGPLPIPVVRLWLGQVAAALDYAHGRGIVHRDLKPANVLIDTEGNAVLTDFGIAKLEVNPQWKTVTGGFLGTPQYASPEQCKGIPVTPASDQYSLGVVAYAMLTGKPPFDANSFGALILAHTAEDPAPLRSLRPDCPEDLAEAVHRMLAKAPENRWPNMRAVSAAMGSPPPPGTPTWQQAAALSGGRPLADASPPTWVTPIPSPTREAVTPSRRRGRRGLLLGGAAAAAAAALVWVGWPRGAAAPAADASTAARTDSAVTAGGPGGATRQAGERTATVPRDAGASRPSGESRVTLRLPVTRLRVGDSVRPEVLALDGGGGTGRAVAGASFAVGAPDVAYVSSSGWIVGVGPGSSRVTARAQGGEFTETVTVEAVVPALASLSAGEEHTCGIAPDGTPYCWGANDRGQVAPGRGPAFRVPLPLPFSGRFTAVAAGGNHTCALRSDGRIVCWGGLESPSGQYRAITAGARHACALAADGTTRCWGANDRGQLGIGSTGGRGASRPVAGDVAFELLASGAEHTCGLLDGRVYCWGSDAAGQTGTGNIQQGYVSQPTEVAGAHEHFVFLTAGTDHTCALTRVGWAFCWGSNEHGQLGDGSKRSRYAPRPVQPAMGGTQLSFSTLSAGGTHTCGVTVRQQLYCWGDNTFGQLGDGTSQSRVVPQRVRGDARYRAVTAGRYHTCALTTGGESRCWGRNEDGQLGDGTRTNRVQGAVPGAVSREP